MTELDKDLVTLAKFQDTGLKIDQTKHALESMPEQKTYNNAKDEFQQSKMIFDELAAEKDILDKEIKRIENDTRSADTKIENDEKKLYSGQIANPKELKAIQAEIESIKKRKDDLETAELETLEKLDTLNLRMEPVIKKVDESKIKLETSKNEFEERKTALEKTLNELSDKFTALRQQVPQETLAKYEKISREKHGVAVSVLKDGVCTGCHLAMPAEDMSNFLAERKLGRCPNCKRMLLPPEYGEISE